MRISTSATFVFGGVVPKTPVCSFLIFSISALIRSFIPISSRSIAEGQEADLFVKRIDTIVDKYFEDNQKPNFFKENGISIGRRACKRAYRNSYFEGEIFLPIFIGKDDIPQLSWGHAKYGHYMNEKGFNFFKFKHADHLPSAHLRETEPGLDTSV